MCMRACVCIFNFFDFVILFSFVFILFDFFHWQRAPLLLEIMVLFLSNIASNIYNSNRQIYKKRASYSFGCVYRANFYFIFNAFHFGSSSSSSCLFSGFADESFVSFVRAFEIRHFVVCISKVYAHAYIHIYVLLFTYFV